MNVSCFCLNIKVRVASVASNDDVVVDTVKFTGPVTLGLGGCSTSFDALSEKIDVVDSFVAEKCLNCGCMVWGTNTKREGSVYVNMALMGAQKNPFAESGAIFSKPFGIFLLKEQKHAAQSATGPNSEVKVKVNRLLEHFKESVQIEKDEKIAAFIKKCEKEATDVLLEATGDASFLLQKIASVARVEKSNIASPEKVVEETSNHKTDSTSESAAKAVDNNGKETKADFKGKTEMISSSWSHVKKSESGGEEENKRKALAGSGRKKGSVNSTNNNSNSNNSNNNGINSNSNNNNTLMSKGKNKSQNNLDVLWSLDEEVENTRAENLNESANNNSENEDDELNVSASGLLPSSKKVLFGSTEDATSKTTANKEKFVMAQSVPVSIPSVWGGRARSSSSAEPSRAVRFEEDEKQIKFERPDVIAANTWQEQVRMDWIAQSQSKLRNKSADMEELDFIMASQTQTQKAKPFRNE